MQPTQPRTDPTEFRQACHQGLHGRRQSAEQGQHLRAGCACRLVAQGLLQRMGVFRGLLRTDVGCHGFQRVGKPFGQPLVARCDRRINPGNNG